MPSRSLRPSRAPMRACITISASQPRPTWPCAHARVRWPAPHPVPPAEAAVGCCAGEAEHGRRADDRDGLRHPLDPDDHRVQGRQARRHHHRRRAQGEPR